MARLLRRAASRPEAAWLHAEVARRMAPRLQALRTPPATWHDWWAHRGGGAEAVEAVWPDAQRVVVEAPSGVPQARSPRPEASGWRWPWQRRTASRSAPLMPAAAVRLEDAVADGEAELVWANLVLPATEDADAMLARWQRALRPGGALVFSTWGPETLRELHALHAARGWPPPGPVQPDMHDVGDALLRAGWENPVMDREVLTLAWSSPEAMAEELRTLDGNLAAGRPPGLRTPRWRQAWLDALRGTMRDGRLRMSVEIVFGHAWRGATQRLADGRTALPLAALTATLPSRRGA